MSYYPIIVPYLAVSDADAAIAFYKRAFGAEEKMRVPGENRGVMHAEVLINGGLVMLTDAAPEVGFPAAKPGDQVPVGIMVCWPRPEQVDEVFARAIGGRRQGRDRAPRRTLGARFAAVRDPFGQRWWLHAKLADKEGGAA